MMDNLQDDFPTQKYQEACVEELATNISQQGEQKKFNYNRIFSKSISSVKEVWMVILI